MAGKIFLRPETAGPRDKAFRTGDNALPVGMNNYTFYRISGMLTDAWEAGTVFNVKITSP